MIITMQWFIIITDQYTIFKEYHLVEASVLSSSSGLYEACIYSYTYNYVGR